MSTGEEVEATAQAIAGGAEVLAARASKMTVVVIVIAEVPGEEAIRVAAGCAIRASLPRDVVLGSISAIVDSLDVGEAVPCSCEKCRGGRAVH